MAVAGSMTTAYALRMNGEILRADRTTYPSADCTPPAAAVAQLRNWTRDSKPPIVQGSDMAAFWQLWSGAQA